MLRPLRVGVKFDAQSLASILVNVFEDEKDVLNCDKNEDGKVMSWKSS